MDDDTYSNVIDWKTREPIAEPPLWRRALRSWQASVVVVALTWGMLAAWIGLAVHHDRWIEVPVGESRAYQLTDGSAVQVGSGTRLHLDFGDNRRFVHLRHGEAYFTVAKDRSRPFVVESGSIETRAVGTRFAVTRRGNRVVVTVQEGSVEVGRQNGEHGSVPVAAGQQLDVSKVWPSVARDVDVERELAWTVGKLIFGEGDTIDAAVAEFNYRNRLQIVVEDGAIRRRRIDGVFLADRPEEFVTFLQGNLPVRIDRDQPGVLRVVTKRAVSPARDQPDRPDRD